MDGLELAVAVAVLFDLGEFRLKLTHELGLVKLALDERPHAKLDQDDKENNSEPEVTNVIIDEKEDVGDWADDNRIY